MAVLGSAAIAQNGGSSDRGSTPSRTTIPAREEFTIQRASGEVSVDARLDEDAWNSAMRLPLRYEVSPGNNTQARVETMCLVTFDDDNLYFGCEASDPSPESIRAYVTDRDDVGQHDRVGISIDPFNDARRAFSFAVSALGVQMDAVFDQQQQQQQNDGNQGLSWDAIWNSAGRITQDGYVVEAAIPFKSLRFPSTGDVQTWGIYAWRMWPRSENVEFRSMRLDRNNSCVLCQANLATGFQGIAPGTNLQFTPTLTSSKTDTRSSLSAPMEPGRVDGEPGLDVQWGITTDLTLNATVNPDFSQVEADAAQLDVNNRFALFFPEKRPFFLEGADFFSTPLPAVFTRTIVSPVAGTKITGKSGANAVGAIVARDRLTNLTFPSSRESDDTSISQGATTFIARYRRDVGASSNVGVLYAGREGAGYHNRVAGVDGFWRPLRSVTARFQYLRSETAYPEAVAEDFAQRTEGFGGDALSLTVNYSTRSWRLQANYRQLSPGFRADAGFINQVDARNIGVWGGRTLWGRRGGWFSRMEINGGAWHSEAFDGRLNQEGIWANVFYEGPLQTFFWFNPNKRRENVDGRMLDQLQLWTGMGIRPSGNIGMRLEGSVGDFADYANSQGGFQISAGPAIDLRLGTHVDLRLSHNVQRMSRDGQEVFTANLSQLRLVYNFNPRTFIRAIVQYRDVTRNPVTNAGSFAPEQRSVFGQFLFSYKVNPQTVFFLGYSDNLQAETAQDLTRTDFTRTNRSLFMKIGYALRP